MDTKVVLSFVLFFKRFFVCVKAMSRTCGLNLATIVCDCETRFACAHSSRFSFSASSFFFPFLSALAFACLNGFKRGKRSKTNLHHDTTLNCYHNRLLLSVPRVLSSHTNNKKPFTPLILFLKSNFLTKIKSKLL